MGRMQHYCSTMKHCDPVEWQQRRKVRAEEGAATEIEVFSLCHSIVWDFRILCRIIRSEKNR